MRALLTLLFLIISIHGTLATSYYSIADGSWSDGSIWSLTSDGPVANQSPSPGDDVHIEGHDIILDTDMTGQQGIELYITQGGSLTSSTTEGILIATNGNLDITNGFINVITVEMKNGAIVDIGSDGTLTTDQYVVNKATITVDGTMNVGTYLDNDGTISGNGTITAAQYEGTGEVFGITPTSDIPDGATVGGWTWEGAASTDWNNATNWYIGSVPTSTSNVTVMSVANHPAVSTAAECNNMTINTGASLDINETHSLTINGDLSNSGTLTINSSSTGTGSLIVNGSSTGSVVIERYLPDGGWHFVSPSTTGVTANDFYWNDNPVSWLTFHTESSNEWTYNTPLTTPMPVGQGWSVWLDNSVLAAATATMTGSIQVSDFEATLESSGTGINEGWNLLGNPFASAIDWDQGGWGSNTTGTVYVWDNDLNGSGDWASWNGSAGDLTNGIIPVSQAFFVKATSAGAFNIPTTARIHDITSFYKETETLNSPYVRLQMDFDDHGNTVFIGFPEHGTEEFDYRGDATKIFSNDLPQIYVMEKEHKLCINALPELNNEVRSVPLYLGQVIDGNYTFSLSQLENLPDVKILLEDKKTQTKHELSEDPVFHFTSAKGDDPDRFLLHFTKSTFNIGETRNGNSELIQIYADNSRIYIKSKGKAIKEEGEAIVFNLLGQKLMHKRIGPGIFTSITLPAEGQALIVKVIKTSANKTSKLLTR